MNPKIITELPGPRSERLLNKLRKLNVGYTDPYPFVHSKEGSGCYFKDIDGNTFLDFGSQVASNPLGYNNHELIEVIKEYANRHPIKYAGQDFTVKEHIALLEELFTITPGDLKTGILINSGAEAVENCLKLAMRKQKLSRFGISFEHAFHGRTLGALSCTQSKPVYTDNFLGIPMKRLPFDESAVDMLKDIAKKSGKHDVGFVIIEPIQGEGGYNIAPDGLMKGIRKVTKEYDIPFIVDEVQSGMGRTGKWWASQHYNITPDIMAASKALQVGAAITSEKYRPAPGTVSSTWGGGHILDMALGLKTIQMIKKRNLLNNVSRQGAYLLKQLHGIDYIQEQRGKGLMIAFDLPSRGMRNNFIIECLKQGLVLLGCGYKSVRVIPPYIVGKEELDQAVSIIEHAAAKTTRPSFRHTGKVCRYLNCGEMHT